MTFAFPETRAIPVMVIGRLLPPQAGAPSVGSTTWPESGSARRGCPVLGQYGHAGTGSGGSILVVPTGCGTHGGAAGLASGSPTVTVLPSWVSQPPNVLI